MEYVQPSKSRKYVDMSPLSGAWI